MIKSIGTKIVNLLPMTRLAYNQFRGWELPTNESGEDAGYLVEYLDGGQPNTQEYKGYVSWSPKAQADAAYSPLTAMSFSHALTLIKEGYGVTRRGWNGENMFVFMPQTNTSKYSPHFLLRNPDSTYSVWVPSTSDCLAEDWSVSN